MAREKKPAQPESPDRVPTFDELQAWALENGWTGATDEQAFKAWKAKKQGPGPCTERFTDQTIADAPPLPDKTVEEVAKANAAPARHTQDRDPADRLDWKRERAKQLGLTRD